MQPTLIDFDEETIRNFLKEVHFPFLIYFSLTALLIAVVYDWYSRSIQNNSSYFESIKAPITYLGSILLASMFFLSIFSELFFKTFSALFPTSRNVKIELKNAFTGKSLKGASIEFYTNLGKIQKLSGNDSGIYSGTIYFREEEKAWNFVINRDSFQTRVINPNAESFSEDEPLSVMVTPDISWVLDNIHVKFVKNSKKNSDCCQDSIFFGKISSGSHDTLLVHEESK